MKSKVTLIRTTIASLVQDQVMAASLVSQLIPLQTMDKAKKLLESLGLDKTLEQDIESALIKVEVYK